MWATGRSIILCLARYRMFTHSLPLKTVCPLPLSSPHPISGPDQADPQVRQTLTAQPANLSTLIIHLSKHLFALLPSEFFPTPSSASSAPTGQNGQDTTREALNCLRVLGRILVVVYEAEATSREGGVSAGEGFARECLWARQPVVGDDEVRMSVGAGAGGAGGIEDEGQFTIEDSDEEDGAEEEDPDDAGDIGRSETPKKEKERREKGRVPAQAQSTANGNGGADPLSAPSPAPQRTAEDLQPSLIDRLFSCTIDLLFCAGFTVPESVRGQQDAGEKVNVSPGPRSGNGGQG